MKRFGKAKRWLRRGLLLGLLLPVVLPLGFRACAAIRERYPAGTGGPQNATFVEIEGLSIHYMERGPDAVQGRPRERPAVVFVPGAMAWSKTWLPLMDRAVAEGYRAVALDLPPFGYSARPVDQDYGRGAQARRIQAFLSKRNLREVVLVGHSFGGGATVEAAFAIEDRAAEDGATQIRGRGRDPVRVVALALLDVALNLEPALEAEESDRTAFVTDWEDEDSGSRELKNPPPLAPMFALSPVRNVLVASTFTNPWLTGVGLRSLVADDSVVTPKKVAIYQAPLGIVGTTAAVGHWFVHGLYGDTGPRRSAVPARYRAYTRPVLLVWGREDSVTPLSQGRSLQRLLPNSSLVVLDRVNHIPHLEAPERTGDALVTFLNERVSEKGTDRTQ